MSLEFGKVVKFGNFFQQYTEDTTTSTHSVDEIYKNDKGESFQKITCGSKDYFFAKEPIHWLVIKSSNNQHLLMALNLLKIIEFDENKDNNNYKNSKIRTYLENEFYNTAFSSEEKAIILRSSVDGEKTYVNDFNGDHVVLPSLTDLTSDLNWQLFSLKATPYAQITEHRLGGYNNSILTRTPGSPEYLGVGAGTKYNTVKMIAQSYSGDNFAQIRQATIATPTGIVPILWIKNPSVEMLTKMEVK